MIHIFTVKASILIFPFKIINKNCISTLITNRILIIKVEITNSKTQTLLTIRKKGKTNYLEGVVLPVRKILKNLLLKSEIMSTNKIGIKN